MRLVIISDAWRPQVNGVVRSYENTVFWLEKTGHKVMVIGPNRFRTASLPSYPQIEFALPSRQRLRKLIDQFAPESVHIGTEGPLGWAARRMCIARRWSFTTSYHTEFPDYVWLRTRFPRAWTYAVLRRFHNRGDAIMVATESLERKLRARGFERLARWSRGVDTNLFRPRDKSFLALPRPVHLYVGRVAKEKNLPTFLRLELPGTKLVVGNGPAFAEYRTRFPETIFVGEKEGEELARYYAAADVFVFPSVTDTFGLVLLEALASGVPVAAFPVQGPLDVIGRSGVGALSGNLAMAISEALKIAPADCRAFAIQNDWRASSEQFLSHLTHVHGGRFAVDRRTTAH